MEQEYPFKRSIYYKVLKALCKSRVVFLLGPRKCGKSVCLDQLHKNVPSSKYYDISKYRDYDREALCDQIEIELTSGKYPLVLIDEITKVDCFYTHVQRFVRAVNDSSIAKTRVVITGSQSYSLARVGGVSTAGDGGYVTDEFLSYSDWLRWKGEQACEKSFKEFVCGTRSFYRNFATVNDYLTGCLDETVISNANIGMPIYHNSCSSISVQFLLNTLYGAMLSLNGNERLQTFYDWSRLYNTLRATQPKEVQKEGRTNILDRINKLLHNHLTTYQKADISTIMEALIFLHNCGLIHMVSEGTIDEYFPVLQELKAENPLHIHKKEDIFLKVNIILKYPMFYIDLVKEALGVSMPQTIDNNLLGRIYECYVRSYLDEYNGHVYRSNNKKEVDYIDTLRHTAVEMSVDYKQIRDTVLLDFGDAYAKYLLGSGPTKRDKQVFRVNCYEYIKYLCDLSDNPLMFTNDGKLIVASVKDIELYCQQNRIEMSEFNQPILLCWGSDPLAIRAACPKFNWSNLSIQTFKE